MVPHPFRIYPRGEPSGKFIVITFDHSRSIEARMEASNNGDVDASMAIKGGLEMKQGQMTATQKSASVKSERVQEKTKMSKN